MPLAEDFTHFNSLKTFPEVQVTDVEPADTHVRVPGGGPLQRSVSQLDVTARCHSSMSQLDVVNSEHFHTLNRSIRGGISQLLSQLVSQLLSQLPQAVFSIWIRCTGGGILDDFQVRKSLQVALQGSAVDAGEC